jgi:hypothetical protein
MKTDIFDGTDGRREWQIDSRGVSDLIRSTAGWRLKQARWLRLIDPGVIILV